MFRGREQAHPERGRALLDRLYDDVAELATIEQAPQQEGRNMHMMLAPSGRAPPGPRAAHARAECSAGPTRPDAVWRPPPCRWRRAEPPHRAGPAARRAARRVCFNSRSDAEDEDRFGRQEALSQDRQRQAARPARLFEPHPREEVAEAQAADERGRSRSLRRTASGSRKLLGSRNEPDHERRRPQAAPQEGPQAGEGLLGPQALELPARERAGDALGPVRLPRSAPAQARHAAAVDRRGSTPPRGAGDDATRSSSTASPRPASR